MNYAHIYEELPLDSFERFNVARLTFISNCLLCSVSHSRSRNIRNYAQSYRLSWWNCYHFNSKPIAHAKKNICHLHVIFVTHYLYRLSSTTSANVEQLTAFFSKLLALTIRTATAYVWTSRLPVEERTVFLCYEHSQAYSWGATNLVCSRKHHRYEMNCTVPQFHRISRRFICDDNG